ncbi:hypothetical protein CIPAW_15G172500 [Carya illinoinensis]|uniref:GH18 domain-containing protein n=1 Tax=Carya illinoinensis TaxID=32201 RepID=A0A8T1N8K3_CARIL|nr:hypothetical protein CIPAW_15G172500 [Carya illinoinensis]
MASSGGTDVVKAGYWFFRPDNIRLVAEIPSELFTHLYAGFAVVNSDTGGMTFPPKYEEQFQTFPDTVRQRNPTVKALLSIGGEGADLSAVVASSDKRKNLITESIDLAKKFHFDGLDLCWLYPSKADQEEPLSSLLFEWRSALDLDFTKTREPTNKLLLTAAVFHHPGIPDIDGNITFNYLNPAIINAVNEKLDWINVLAIDFYTPSPSNSPEQTGPVHAWRNPREQNRCGSEGIKKWIDGGVAANKLVLGLPFYGYAWILTNPSSLSGLFAPAHTASELPMAYRDIQDELRRGTYETVYDSQYYAVYSNKINGDKWIVYDDGLCIFGKVREAIDLKLGGYFAWRVGADDIYWTLSRSGKLAADFQLCDACMSVVNS